MSIKKLSFIILLICFVFSAEAQTKHKASNGYKPFPKVYQNRDSLARFIVPDKNITYWEFDDGQMDTTRNGIILFSKGNKPAGVNFKDPGGYMLSGCMPAFCYKYIAYVANGRIGYIKSNPELIKFMGAIDNLGEAVLLAQISIQGFVGVDADARGGAYKATINDTFDFILTKYNLCPESKEAIPVTVTKEGMVKQLKPHVYHKDKGCAVI